MKFYVLLTALTLISKLLIAQSIYFPPTTSSTWDTIAPDSLNWCTDKIDSLYTYLEDNNTKAFIILKDGKIVLEKYFNGHTDTTNWQWASAGKAITAFMTGIAQQEGFLSIEDSSSKYLGSGWTNCTPEQESEITIKHQLSMTSGLDDGVTDIFCTDDTCLQYKADAGTRWAYHNGPYTLLDGVIQNATSKSLNLYTTQKLKTPTGMNGLFVPIGYNNVFFSTARSMARFGILMLNKGNWNGTQIMTDTNYYQQQINTSQSLNLSYGYLWWLNGKSSNMIPNSQTVFLGSLMPNAPDDMYAAMGKDGQFLDVIPSQNLIVVRMGEAPDGLPVPYLMNDIMWQYINDLTCPTSIDDKDLKVVLQLFPNPAKDKIQIHSNLDIKDIEVLDLQSKLHYHYVDSKSIDIQKLSQGIYFVKITLADGKTIFRKFVKE